MSEKLKTLETEKRNLLVEIEELKKQAESKATALESEVRMLREEVESFRTLLGLNEIASEKTVFEKGSGETPPASKPEKAERGKSKFNILK